MKPILYLSISVVYGACASPKARYADLDSASVLTRADASLTARRARLCARRFKSPGATNATGRATSVVPFR